MGRPSNSSKPVPGLKVGAAESAPLRFLLLVYLCFFQKMARVRVVLFLVTIPIAIVADAGRMTITGGWGVSWTFR